MLACPFFLLKTISGVFESVISGWRFVFPDDEFGVMVARSLEIVGLLALAGSTISSVISKPVGSVVFLFEGDLRVVAGLFPFADDSLFEVHALV